MFETNKQINEPRIQDEHDYDPSIEIPLGVNDDNPRAYMMYCKTNCC